MIADTTPLKMVVTAENLAISLPGISLAELNDAAALQTRVDRKYVLGGNELAALVDGLGDRLAVLDIDGRRTFGYESIYFDTPDLECYHSAAYRRRNRFKVRTRTYLDTQTTMLEVKTKGQRQQTVKQRRPHQFDDRDYLDAESQGFVEQMLGRPGIATKLAPVLTTSYDRTTLVDLDGIARLTIDTDLLLTTVAGCRTGLTAFAIVETKSGGGPSAADRFLWSQGVRPTKISKFGTGMAALDATLPSNKWNRTLNRYFR